MGPKWTYYHPMEHCVVCGLGLVRKQTKYCSTECKNRCTNNRLQSYSAQQERGRRRKAELVELGGGSCRYCGYSRNLAALEFHHTDSSEKSFSLDLRSLSNRRFSVILDEFRKCQLVCSNCHKEIHHPQFRRKKAGLCPAFVVQKKID